VIAIKAYLQQFPELFHKQFKHTVYQHLAANIQKRYLLAARNHFWRIARAKTPQEFEDAVTEMQNIRNDAMQYLREIMGICTFSRTLIWT